jgi:hypothetical protein
VGCMLCCARDGAVPDVAPRAWHALALRTCGLHLRRLARIASVREHRVLPRSSTTAGSVKVPSSSGLPSLPLSSSVSRPAGGLGPQRAWQPRQRRAGSWQGVGRKVASRVQCSRAERQGQSECRCRCSTCISHGAINFNTSPGLSLTLQNCDSAARRRVRRRREHRALARSEECAHKRLWRLDLPSMMMTVWRAAGGERCPPLASLPSSLGRNVRLPVPVQLSARVGFPFLLRREEPFALVRVLPVSAATGHSTT